MVDQRQQDDRGEQRQHEHDGQHGLDGGRSRGRLVVDPQRHRELARRDAGEAAQQQVDVRQPLALPPAHLDAVAGHDDLRRPGTRHRIGVARHALDRDGGVDAAQRSRRPAHVRRQSRIGAGQAVRARARGHRLVDGQGVAHPDLHAVGGGADDQGRAGLARTGQRGRQHGACAPAVAGVGDGRGAADGVAAEPHVEPEGAVGRQRQQGRLHACRVAGPGDRRGADHDGGERQGQPADHGDEPRQRRHAQRPRRPRRRGRSGRDGVGLRRRVARVARGRHGAILVHSGPMIDRLPDLRTARRRTAPRTARGRRRARRAARRACPARRSGRRPSRGSGRRRGSWRAGAR